MIDNYRYSLVVYVQDEEIMTINPDGPADEAERSLRLGRVRAAMRAAGLDALLAFAPAWRRENVR